MGSLDVDSLFTNIPFEEIINICTASLYDQNDVVGIYYKSSTDIGNPNQTNMWEELRTSTNLHKARNVPFVFCFFFNETDKIFNFEVVFSIQIWIYTVLQFPILLPVTGPTPHATVTYSFCCSNRSFLLQRLREHKVEYVKKISYWLLIPGIEWGYKPFQLCYFIWW